MRALSAVIVIVVALLVPVSSGAWGMDVHRFLTRRALEGLPPGMLPFFKARADFISEHSADPDLWRVVNLRGEMGEENPNHFLDLDGLDEPAPFTGVPRDRQAFLGRYGTERAERMGRLPWRAAEIDALLVQAFTAMGTGTSPYAADNARYLSAVLAHYIEDAHQPFHASVNHDGQLTNQRGIHSRFETDLVLRNLSKLKLVPVRIQPIANMRDFIFDTLAASQSLVEPVLAADRRAVDGRTLYDNAYFKDLLGDTRPILERRLSESAAAVASAIVSAWERGGKPPLTAGTARTPARIRR